MSPRASRLIVLSALLLISFTLLSVINYRTVADSIHDEIVSSSLPLLQENLYTEIQTDLSPALNIASMMASDSFLIRWAEAGENDTDRLIEYLDTIRREYGYFSVFFVSAGTSSYYHQTGITKRISPDDEHDAWYYDFVASGQPYRIDVDTNEAADDRLTIFVNYRLEDFSNDLLGVTGVGLEMDGFARFLRSRQEKYDRTIYLVDRTGLVQAHPDPSLIQRRSIREHASLGRVADSLLTPADGPVDAEYTDGGDTILVSSRYMPELDWFLIVEQNETRSLRSARANLFRTILVGLVVSAAIITLSSLTMRRFDLRLEKLATTDELTGAANRRQFDSRLAEASSRADRSGTPLSLVMFDIDNLKEINDEHGHAMGDLVIKRISATVREMTRLSDCLARWGGDEFALLVESGGADARLLALRIQRRLTDDPGEQPPATISVGIAEHHADDTPESLFRRADQALYRSKEAGRNRITVAE